MQTTLARLGRRYAQVGQAWWHPPALPHGGRGSGAPISWCQLWHGSATACPAGIEAGGSRAHCLNGGSKFFFWLCADCALPVAGGSQADDWASGARGAAAGKAKQFCRQKCATGCTPGRACSRLACGAYPVPLICMCCTASIICQYVNPFPWCGAARAALEGLEKLAPSAPSCVF